MIDATAKREAVDGQLTPTKRVVYADQDGNAVDFIGYRLRGAPWREHFVEVDPTTGDEIGRHSFDHADLLYEESLE